MNHFKRTWVLKKSISLFVCLFFMLSGHAFAAYDTVVAFGDSLSDHGGLVSYLGPYDPVNNPTGAFEAWTNGDTWVEYFADELQATLENNSIAGAMTQGHENEAVQALSDAGTFPQLGLVGQVNTYIDSAPSYTPSTTLFTIWIGGNNLLEFGRGELYTQDPLVMVSDAMANIQTAITSLYADGAVNFLVMSLPDIGLTPSYNTRSAQEIAQATALASNYNSSLYNQVQSLRTNLSGITIYYFDVFPYLHSIIDQGYFANTTGRYTTLDYSGVNGPAEDYLFWDSIHPTTRAHEYVGKQVAQDILAVSATDDDSTCFISTLGQAPTHPADADSLYAIMALALFGLAGFSIKKIGRS